MYVNEQLARRAEKNGEWRKAESLWRTLSYGTEHANTCKTIADAVELGDKYRKLTEGVYDRWGKHEINNKELHEILRKAHDEVYGKRV